MARVIRTPLAREDIKEIGRYIAGESQSRDIAERFLDAVAHKCAFYATERELGEHCPELGADVRRFTVGNYLVFYRSVKRGIEILRVLHGSRDVPSTWVKE